MSLQVVQALRALATAGEISPALLNAVDLWQNFGAAVEPKQLELLKRQTPARFKTAKGPLYRLAAVSKQKPALRAQVGSWTTSLAAAKAFRNELYFEFDAEQHYVAIFVLPQVEQKRVIINIAAFHRDPAVKEAVQHFEQTGEWSSGGGFDFGASQEEVAYVNPALGPKSILLIEGPTRAWLPAKQVL